MNIYSGHEDFTLVNKRIIDDGIPNILYRGRDIHFYASLPFSFIGEFETGMKYFFKSMKKLF